ncbi:amidase signature domain-containing protein [Chytriomyces sp. MP71]|nr:amidase signature domain-containing protein [Chytriomyces sp. MP71]
MILRSCRRGVRTTSTVTPSTTHGVLRGWQIGVKDNVCVAGTETQCASLVLKGFRPPFSATVVEQLENNGAAIAASLGMDEFGMGSFGIHGAFGIEKNPLDPRRVCGGSSSGSAAAVARNHVRASIGTDTGGSVRLPASYCGVIGFKPTYGRLSRWGVISYASSLDTVGILARNVNDCKAIFDVLNHRDPKDSTSLSFTPTSSASSLAPSPSHLSLKGITIGVPDHIPHLLPHETLMRLSSALDHLELGGASITSINLPNIDHALSAYYTIACAEASSNLARYDGIRYGARGEGEDSLVRSVEDVRGSFGGVVQRRILLGSFVLGSSAYASYFSQSQKIRRLLQQSYNSVFKLPHPLTPSDSYSRVDFILTPTSATPAPLRSVVEAGGLVDECSDDVLTVPVSLAGLPAVSVPWWNEGVTRVGEFERTEEQLPIGLQVVGQFGDDARVLEMARILESME